MKFAIAALLALAACTNDPNPTDNVSCDTAAYEAHLGSAASGWMRCDRACAEPPTTDGQCSAMVGSAMVNCGSFSADGERGCCVPVTGQDVSVQFVPCENATP